MFDLRFDTDVMQNTINEYQSIYDGIQDLKNRLSKDMEDLRDVYWQSEAGTAFFAKYNAGWADNVDVYLKVVDFLKTQLIDAKGKYEALYQEAEKLKIDLGN